MAKTISRAELGQHNKEGDLWMSIDGDVYDLSKFGRMHPGGEVVLREHAGKDATEAFFSMHRIDVLAKYKRLRVGRMEGAQGVSSVDKQLAPGSLSNEPFTEPTFAHGFKSPFYTESHLKFMKAVRAWVDTELRPVAEQFDKSGKYPTRELYKKIGLNGMFAARVGPGWWMERLAEWGIKLPGGLDGKNFDQFHELIAHAEIAKLGTPGFVDGIGAGHLIGVPVILNFSPRHIQEKLLGPCLRGEKVCVLAITEPFAGSDVAGVKCTAVKSPCGKFYIVNGVKKWITNAMFCDYIVTTVRTGGKGAKGISMLLIENGPGVTCKQITTSYSPSAGTALVEFKDVKVPVENLLGKENDGFKIVMHNFNHERWVINVVQLAQAREVVTDCFRWARQRKVFGKPLIEQPVIRYKLGRMVAQLEATWAWMEWVSYQMKVMPFEERQLKLGGIIALLKAQTTRTVWNIVDDAVQIFGGRGVTQGGMGRRVEAILRASKVAAIYGGSEEICLDLGVRQALKAVKNPPKL
eukprot:Hpha_TRINITY_DN16047_c1_g2::TRINITY_DN16047_c1_g2_i1::g.121120::m.121120